MISPDQEVATTERHRWVSCCLHTDRQAVVYIGQMLFSGVLVGLCGVMLARADGACEQSSPYLNLLSFLAGKILATVVDSAVR
jgi:hypothetical protein